MGSFALVVRGVLLAALLLPAAVSAAPLLPAFHTLDGAAVPAASMHGKVTLVALFSVTCPFCNNHAVLNVVSVSVDRSDALAGARKWAHKYGLTHLVTADSARFEAVLGKPKGIPALYVFDRAGRLVRTETGELLDEDFDDIARFAQAQEALAARPAVAIATDLRMDGMAAKRSGTPLLLFFTLPDCTYCHTVRQNYLAPLVRGEGGQRYVVREIVIDGKSKAVGLDGKAVTHGELARRFKARFGPTVLFVDAAGKAMAPALVGGDTVGMYGAYLDSRLAVARARLAGSSNVTERL
jgi:hypothetical protein